MLMQTPAALKVTLDRQEDENVTSRPGSLGRDVAVPGRGGFLRKMAAFTGPGYLVAVGYMDPGNWATDIAGGAQFGYTLLFVIVMASAMAVLLQSLAAKLGVATGLDLAQACRTRYRPATCKFLWVLCELAIIACDVAEVIGTAIALQLLFGIPLPMGACLTAVSTVLLITLQQGGVRKLEAVVVTLIAVTTGCLIVELLLAQPDWNGVAQGLIPTTAIIGDESMLYIAIGIIGATVMPHNLYLHSSIVKTRSYLRTIGGKREAVRFATFDTVIALSLAVFVNAAILILAATTFHGRADAGAIDIAKAYSLLTPMIGGGASVIFAAALLAAGQNSTLTGTLAGQIVMDGFTDFRLSPWKRRLISRSLALIPAVYASYYFGSVGATHLLVLTQVILSLQLPFAVVPLVAFTSDRDLMGSFANRPRTRNLAWTVCGLLICLNLWLVVQWALGQ
jgi:manganese transport protein